MADKLVSIRVNVTQRDIERGERLDCRNCPLARALKRATGRVIEVLGSSFRVVKGQKRIMPRKLVAFVDGFDCGHWLPPLTECIEVPSRWLKRKGVKR